MLFPSEIVDPHCFAVLGASVYFEGGENFFPFPCSKLSISSDANMH